jgi:hypothetical protein
MLAISSPLVGSSACGAATGVELFDGSGNDGGGKDATLDSAGDVVVADAAACLQNPEMSECCGFGPPSGGLSCEFDFGATVCGPNGWTCPNGGSPAPGCSKLCMIAPEGSYRTAT